MMIDDNKLHNVKTTLASYTGEWEYSNTNESVTDLSFKHAIDDDTASIFHKPNQFQSGWPRATTPVFSSLSCYDSWRWDQNARLKKTEVK